LEVIIYDHGACLPVVVLILRRKYLPLKSRFRRETVAKAAPCLGGEAQGCPTYDVSY